MQNNLSQSADKKYHAMKITNDKTNHTDEIAIVINASSIGLFNQSAPAWLSQLINKLPDDCLCFDIVYSKNNSKPYFAQLAIARKLRIIDGLSMLIHQARYAFKYWTGVDVPVEIMHNALNTIQK